MKLTRNTIKTLGITACLITLGLICYCTVGLPRFAFGPQLKAETTGEAIISVLSICNETENSTVGSWVYRMDTSSLSCSKAKVRYRKEKHRLCSTVFGVVYACCKVLDYKVGNHLKC